MELHGRYCVRIFLVVFVALQTYAQTPAVSDHWSVMQLVEYHQQLRPELQVQDVYKMLYEGNFGIQHFLTDTAQVRHDLLSELATMDTTDRGEQLIERISTRDEIVRINLRPFRELKLDPNKLIGVMFSSALETKPDTEGFYHDWIEFTALVRYGFLRFPMKDGEDWDARVTAGNLQPAHHSQQYVELYKPAYRVVKRAVFESAFHNVDLEASTKERKR